MKTKILAVDLGWGGAAAFQIDDTIGVKDCPGDCWGILSFLGVLMRRYGKEDWDIVLEANGPSPTFGAKGNFGLALNIGSWETALASFELSWESINPKTWQKVCSNVRSKTRNGRKMRKEKAWRYARTQFPFFQEELGDKVPSVTNPKQGRADALCILEWRRKQDG